MEEPTRPHRARRLLQASVLVAFVIVGLFDFAGLVSAGREEPGGATSIVVPVERHVRHAVQAVRPSTLRRAGIDKRAGGASGRVLAVTLTTLTVAIGITCSLHRDTAVRVAPAGRGRIRRRGPPVPALR